jgi:hypothetical protein
MLPRTISRKDTPTPPTVTNTTQLPVTSPLDKDGTVSQVDTNSVTTDFSIERREKDTEPPLESSNDPREDKLQRQVVTVSLDSEGEMVQRIAEVTDEEVTVDSHTVVSDRIGQ